MEVLVCNAEADEFGAGALQLIVLVNEAFFEGMFQGGGVRFGLGSGLAGLFTKIYLPDVRNVFRNLEGSCKQSESNQEEDLPAAAHEASSQPVIQPNEQQADPNHKQCGQYHIDYELPGP